MTSEIVEAAAKVLMDEGGALGHSLHSWRCEHPARYGVCDCVAYAAAQIVSAIEPLIQAAVLKTLGLTVEHGSSVYMNGTGDFHIRRVEKPGILAMRVIPLSEGHALEAASHDD